jgi:hypothetical protein
MEGGGRKEEIWIVCTDIPYAVRLRSFRWLHMRRNEQVRASQLK